ncbi:MAG TPA: ABC-2 family transporter protein [Symbiobacteriaceae bacterium]|nr:ABC-2 family transporter protein [Symbiobacteriaceae bacterium]
MQVGRTGYMRNLAYRWSHMLNNFASAMFGFIYIALWQAVAPATSATDPYTRGTMTHMMAIAQVFAWMTTFLPAGLGIQNGIRTGSIALEMARPVPYFPLVISREAGNLAYAALYRSVPLALVFAVTVGFPLPASWSGLLLTVPSLILGAYMGLTLTYTIGIMALWTTEIRWAHWTYHSLITLLSGGWVPADILPGWVGKVAPYLPFASQQYYPIRIYMGFDRGQGLLVQVAWALVMTVWCQWLTGRALRRVVVQGG